MVDFTLTDEQKALRSWRTTSPSRRSAPSPGSTTRRETGPRTSCARRGSLGLMNTHVGESTGSRGVLPRRLRHRGGARLGLLRHRDLDRANGLASAPLALGGSEELKKEYLGMLTEDFKLASFCLTEPDAGSDVSGMRTTAVRGATSTSSTAPSASSPTAATPPGTRSTPRPTRRPVTAASPASSSPATTRSPWTRRKTRWASAPRTPRRSRSTRPKSRRTT